MKKLIGIVFMVAVLSILILTSSYVLVVRADPTFHFGPGSLTTTHPTAGWGGFNSQVHNVYFNAATNPITVEIRGLNLSQIDYQGDMGWPPTPDDKGAVAGYGLTGSGSVVYQVLSNMANGKGIWNHQANKYINSPPHPNPFDPNDTNDYRSYLFQGWSGSINAGNHQLNAEQWGNGTHPEYDTVDIRFVYSNTVVTAWVRLRASWSWDDNNRTANWGCPWNVAVNNAATGTAENIWDGTCIDEVPAETGRANGAWVRVFDGPWTTSANMSSVRPYVYIHNWAYAAGPYTITWEDLIVTGAVIPPTEIWVDDDWAGLVNGTAVTIPGGRTAYIGYNAFDTIQEGIDAVAGSTVYVLPGTYGEQLTVNKSNVIIRSIDGSAVDGSADTIISPPESTPGGIIISGDGNILQGFKIVDQTGHTHAHRLVKVEGDNNQILNNWIIGRGCPAYEEGVLIRGETTTEDGIAEDNVVDNNEIEQLCIGVNSVSVANNRVARGTIVRNNNLHNNAWIGVSIDRSPNSLVECNTVGPNNNSYAIYCQARETTQGTWASSSGSVIRNNDVRGNAEGARFEACGGVSVLSNAFVGNTRGISIAVEAGNTGTPLINYNTISNNTELGLGNATTEVVNAENNWWGSASGPAHSGNPGGTGDVVSDYVDYTPWLSLPAGLFVTKSDQRDPLQATWWLRYTIRVVNNSGQVMNNVVVTDLLPDPTKTWYISSSPPGIHNAANHTLTWNLNLGPNTSTELQVVMGTRSFARGVVTNTVTAQWGCLFSSDSENTTIIEGPPSPTATPTPTPTAMPTPPPGTEVTIEGGVLGDNLDTYIYRYMPNTNYSTQPLLKVGYKQLFAAILRFDLSAIPLGATIDEAWLEMCAVGWSGPGADITIGAYAISSTVMIGEMTWNEAQEGTTWAGAGCSDILSDRRPIPEYTLTTSGPQKWYRFNLTGLVREWCSGMLPNNGVLLRQEVYLPYTYFFASSEYNDADRRPKLKVRYR